MIRRASAAGYFLYKEAALRVLRLSTTRTILFASGYMMSERHLISSAQSVAVRCSRTLARCFPSSGSINAKMLQVSFRIYSESIFWSSSGRMGSGSLDSHSSWYSFSSMQTTGMSGSYGRLYTSRTSSMQATNSTSSFDGIHQ